MSVLVLYASKHGSAQDIAERIAEKLRQMGKEAEARPVDEVPRPRSYEAFVIGSAVYSGSWLKEATEWVHRNQTVLSKLPVWLWSCGPLGTEIEDAEQQPKELAEFQQTIRPRDLRIFCGALDHNKLSFPERMVGKAVRAPEGDFRDWQAIDAWAANIIRDLGGVGGGSREESLHHLEQRRSARAPSTSLPPAAPARVDYRRRHRLLVFTHVMRSIRAMTRAAVFFLKVFPMLPSQPVDWVTRTPVIEKVRYPTYYGQAKGDLYRPATGGPHPGIVVCLGVVPFGVDHPQVPILGKRWRVRDSLHCSTGRRHAGLQARSRRHREYRPGVSLVDRAPGR